MRRAIRKGRFGGQGGFTLFEIIMVLLLLGLVSYFAATRLFSDDIPTQAAELELLKNHLRYAQSRAMNTERNWGLVFEIQPTGSIPPSKYWLYYENETGNRVSVRLPGDDTSADNKTVLTSLYISSISNTLYSNEIRFFSGAFGSTKPGYFGSPSIANEDANGGNITITTSAGTITIRKNTGFIL